MTLHSAQHDHDAPVISLLVGPRRRFFGWITQLTMGVFGVGLAVPLFGYGVGPLEPLANWVLPILFGLGLLLPFSDRNPERRSGSRPVAVLAGTIFLVTVFTLLGFSSRDLEALPNLDSSVARGRVLFAQNHCLVCHGLHEEGGKAGPDLSHVGNRRTDRAWHIRHLRDPDSVSPGSIMPKFPLSNREMDDLVSYLLSLKGAADPPTEETLETHDMEYAILPQIVVPFSSQAWAEAEECKEEICIMAC